MEWGARLTGKEAVGWPLRAVKAPAAAAPQSGQGRPGPWSLGGVGEGKAGNEGPRPGSIAAGEVRTALRSSMPL